MSQFLPAAACPAGLAYRAGVRNAGAAAPVLAAQARLSWQVLRGVGAVQAHPQTVVQRG